MASLFAECDKTITPMNNEGFAGLLHSDLLQNILTVKLEVLSSWRHYIH
jgi:hypothetical protein